MGSTKISDEQLFEDKRHYDVCTDDFIPKSNGTWNYWISQAKNECYTLRTAHIKNKKKYQSSRFDDDDSSYDERNFLYPDEAIEVESIDTINADLNSFIVALPTCYPLFGHLHNLSSNRYTSFNCFCPCLEQLTPWRKKQYIIYTSRYSDTEYLDV